MLKRSDPRPLLRGDRNQCPTCLRLFNSTAAFEKHRTGDFANGSRRCRTEVEMLAAGMERSASGFWVGSPMPRAALPACAGAPIAASDGATPVRAASGGL